MVTRIERTNDRSEEVAREHARAMERELAAAESRLRRAEHAVESAERFLDNPHTMAADRHLVKRKLDEQLTYVLPRYQRKVDSARKRYDDAIAKLDELRDRAT